MRRDFIHQGFSTSLHKQTSFRCSYRKLFVEIWTSLTTLGTKKIQKKSRELATGFSLENNIVKFTEKAMTSLLPSGIQGTF